MQTSNKLSLLFVMACLSLCCTAQAFAAPALTISSGGNGVFDLQGSDFQAIGGAKIIIKYDTSTLANPRVTQGRLASGAIFLPNTLTPGIVRVGVVSLNGMSGSGVVASIAFDLVGSSPGVIQDLQAEQVIDLEGRAVTVQQHVINPTLLSPPASGAAAPVPSPASDATTVSTATPGQPATSTVTPQPATRTGIVGGLPVQLQIDGTPVPPAGSDRTREKTPTEQSDVTTALIPATDTRTGEPTPPPRETPAGKIQPDHVVYKSVLEQFRTFTGEKTPQTLTAIFTRHAMPAIRQEPAVALSDGTSKLYLTITLPSSEKKAPNFSLKNATLVSLKIESDSGWLIEVLPATGVYSATLTMLRGEAETEIPLLVAPPLPGGAGIGRDDKLTEADFARFLAERGTDKSPRFDLNGDGKRDYIDDYIFTANYLFRKDTVKGSPQR